MARAQIGTRITVRDLHDDVYRATVRLVAGGRITWEIGLLIDTCAVADEGKTWVKGWDTPAANALRTVVALSKAR